ncbi:hypothetical protein C9F11_42880 (plasmid) [Streptomyces sp. YIM 121038]|uniref:hypothetical protein n=1 Tax=Streptomyces sp. YIM 121038 TaxID=2136401 RepID=UPI0011104814|nr:hypothetical protein [Streptomyces sp. YIM 121038]QCX82156.1 hypothetical protein C9F11_42880 [Streptomyces sp. YIM 121038]
MTSLHRPGELSPDEILVSLAHSHGAADHTRPAHLTLERRHIHNLAAASAAGDFTHATCDHCSAPRTQHQSLDLELTYDDRGRLDGITTVACTPLTTDHRPRRHTRNGTRDFLTDVPA